MRLLTFEDGTSTRCGVMLGENVIAAADILGVAHPLRDVQALLELPERPIERLAHALGRTSAKGVPLSSVRLRAPILRPPTMRDFMAFEEHVTQQFTRKSQESLGKFNGINMEAWHRLPVFYFSNTLNILGHDEDLTYPVSSQNMDFESEIGMVIGKEGANVSEQDAADYIVGFTVLNDWSLRDIQADEMGCQLGPCKGKDCATSIGPWIVTPDEFGSDYHEGKLSINSTVRVNGETWAERNTWNMVHSFPAMIARASQDSRVVPGDLFGSGTIGGGTIMESARLGYPARWLQAGDVVEVELEHIGVLRTRIGPPVRTYEQTPYPSAIRVPLTERLSPELKTDLLQRVAKPA